MGDFGRWQLGITIAIAMSGLPGAWFKIGIVFLAPPAEFWCAEPGYINATSLDPSSRYTCSVPVNPGPQPRTHSALNAQPEMRACTHFEYNRTVFTETIITEWDLVCERKQLANVVQMLFMFGFLVGCFVGGLVADKYGRKPPLMVGSVVQLVAGVLCAVVPWFTVFLAFRFLSAVAVGAITVTGFVIMVETIGGKWRTPVNALGGLPFSLGHCMLAGIAFLLRDWRSLQLAVSLPVALQLSYYWLVPESPRWLLAVGKDKQAVEVLQKASAVNKIHVPDWDKALAAFKEAQVQPDPNAAKPGLFSLFRTPVMRKCTLIMYANWAACGLVFYGLVQYMGQVAGNVFINNFLSGVLELPGMVMCMFSLIKLGRRKTLIIAQTVTGLSCLSIMLVPLFGFPEWMTVVFASCGMTAISLAFPAVYIYAAELFPTVVRNIGVGSSSTIARVGSMVSPFVATLTTVSPTLPPVVFGTLPLLAGVLVFMLPETAHRELPDTIAEVENWDRVEEGGELPLEGKEEKGGKENPSFSIETL